MYLLTLASMDGQNIGQYTLQSGKLARIAAVDNVHYQLADAQSGLAAQGVQAGRAGDDLLVHIQGEPALLIENYFLLDDSGLKNPLLGLNGSGQYVAYPIADSAPAILEHQLAGEVAAAGTSGSAVPVAVLAGLAGVGLVGAAIAGSSKGDKAANPQTEQPQTPLDANPPAPPPADNNTPAPPPADNGNVTPPPSGGGNTNPPPSGGGNNPPPILPTPNGKITISGDAKVGQTLTATIQDADGVSGSPQYQWFANGQPIANATQSTYTLTAAEKDARITVRASYTDNQNTAESPVSTATAPVSDNTPAPPANRAPTDLDLPTLQLPENTPGAVIGKLTVTDPDQNDTHTFAVNDPRFEITADGTLKLKAGEKIDYADTQSLDLTVTVTDKAGEQYSKSFTLNVIDDPTYPAPQNHAPTDITLSATTVTEGQAGIVIGTLATVDPDQGDTHSYSVDDPRFEIVNGELKLKAGQALNYDDAQSITVNITSTDKAGEKFSKAFTLEVQDDPNYPAPQNRAPTDLDLPTLQLSENTPGAVIGKLTVTDPDQNDTHTFAVDDPRFEITANGVLKLKAGEKIDYADAPSVPLTITVTDKAGASYEETFTIAVQDDPNYPAPPSGNQAPRDIVLSAAKVLEGREGFEIGTLTVDDPDSSDTHTYRLDDGRFEVVGNKLKLKEHFWLEHDFERAIELEITAIDAAGATFSKRFVLEVEDDPAFPDVEPGNHPGSITVQGTAKVGETLTSDIQDADGGVAWVERYQWFADDRPIAGATSSSYTLRAEDAGKAIHVYVSYVDGKDHRETVNSTQTEPVENGTAQPVLPPPLLENGSGQMQGAVVITPQTGTDRMEVHFVNEGGIPSRVLVEKAGNIWQASGFFSGNMPPNLPGNIVVDAVSGKVTLNADMMQDGSIVKATNSLGALTSAEVRGIAGNNPDLPTLNMFGEEYLQEGISYHYRLFLDKPAERDIVVQLRPQATGSGTLDSDDLVITPETVVIRQGEKEAEFSILAPNDNRQEGVEFFTLDISLPQGGALLHPGLASYLTTLYVSDNPAPQNRAPTDLDLPTLQLSENTPGAVIGKLKVIDPDQNDTHTFAVDDPRFEITADGTLKLKAGEKIDYADTQSLDLTVTVTDKAGASYEETFTIAVQDDPNYPAPAAPNGTVAISGEARVGQTLTAQVTDADGVEEADIEYQWYANDLPIANAIGKTYTLTAAEKDARITVRASYIDAADQDEAPLSTATVPVADALPPPNQPPTDITLDTLTVAEGKRGIVIGKLATVDPDANDSHTYSVDDPRFEIVNGELKLKAGQALNYDDDNTITLKITSTDASGASTEKTFTLAVQDDPNYPAPPPVANGAEDFAKAHVPQGASYVIAGNLTIARLNIAEYEANYGKSPDYLIISDGEHHALVQKGGQGTEIGLPGWKADFTKAGYIPVVAFHDGGNTISEAANAANRATLGANQPKIVHMPPGGEFAHHALIEVKSGVQFYGNGSKLVASASLKEAAIKAQTGGSDMLVDGLILDMSGNPSVALFGIIAQGSKNSTISNNIIYGGKGSAINGSALLGHSVDKLTIANNIIQLHPDTVNSARSTDLKHAVVVQGIPLAIDAMPGTAAEKELWKNAYNDNPGGDTGRAFLYAYGQGKVQDVNPNATVSNLKITGNQIDGGRYGIAINWVGGSVGKDAQGNDIYSNEISNNHIHNNVRNIGMQNGSHGFAIVNNLLTDAKSTAVNFGYDTSHNLIAHNLMSTTVFDSQSPVQINSGSVHNIVRDNRIEAVQAGGKGQWLVYAGRDVSHTQIVDNIISGGAYKSALGIEAIWDPRVSGKEHASYVANNDANFKGGKGAVNGVAIHGNLIAPNLSNPKAPLLYAGADNSKGHSGKSAKNPAYTYPEKPVHGNLDIDSHDNTVLGKQGVHYSELIREHEGAGAKVNGDAKVGGFAESGSSAQKDASLFSIESHQLEDGIANLYLLGNGEQLNGSGNAANNILIGSIKNNILNGMDGNDVIDGGYGQDTLTGGKGADTFVFQSVLKGSANIDTITDFSRADGDKIALSEVLFGKLEGDWFAKDGEAHSAHTRIYQQGNTLYYDADGTGALAATAFANIGQAKLDDSDFTIINKLMIL